MRKHAEALSLSVKGIKRIKIERWGKSRTYSKNSLTRCVKRNNHETYMFSIFLSTEKQSDSPVEVPLVLKNIVRDALKFVQYPWFDNLLPQSAMLYQSQLKLGLAKAALAS
jgi:hypothetical protein